MQHFKPSHLNHHIIIDIRELAKVADTRMIGNVLMARAQVENLAGFKEYHLIVTEPDEEITILVKHPRDRELVKSRLLASINALSSHIAKNDEDLISQLRAKLTAHEALHSEDFYIWNGAAHPDNVTALMEEHKQILINSEDLKDLVLASANIRQQSEKVLREHGYTLVGNEWKSSLHEDKSTTVEECDAAEFKTPEGDDQHLPTNLISTSVKEA